MHRVLAVFAFFIGLSFLSLPATAQTQTDLRSGINALGKGGFSQITEQVGILARTGDMRLVPALQALAAGQLYARKADGSVFIGAENEDMLALTDAVTGESVGKAPKAEFERIKVNNSVRRSVSIAAGTLTLLSPDRVTRLKAANAVFLSPGENGLELITTALEQEKDPLIRKALEEAKSAALLKADASTIDEKRVAVRVIAARGDQDALAILTATRETAMDQLRADIDVAVISLRGQQALWDIVQNIWYGISLGSVLLLAAIGLAITFGVMGIINMAHGEMVMLGAYSTFVVQDIIRTSFPGLFDWSLFIAIPVAFAVTACIGLLIERGVIRFLYGRSLETLLATWGISLILQQGVRTIFGPTNREVGNPSWMSGSFEFGRVLITYNRLWIVAFSLVVFFVLLLVLKKTRFGLQMRAVTQNRRMAASMGIRAPWIDAFTFATGSGIAGMAGVALSQIDNVSPNLGQGYIIDSFMVVVFGGVGNLWGTLVGALSLGVVNKLIEPYAGAVFAKILLLVLIILFIQKRPRGLFALRGRAVES